jgi:hypothetical protein
MSRGDNRPTTGRGTEMDHQSAVNRRNMLLGAATFVAATTLNPT